MVVVVLIDAECHMIAGYLGMRVAELKERALTTMFYLALLHRITYTGPIANALHNYLTFRTRSQSKTVLHDVCTTIIVTD
jgi:hypothetical protein